MRRSVLFLALLVSAGAPATSSAAVQHVNRASGFAPGIGMTSLTFHSLSCLSITNCTAVGWSQDAHGNEVGIRATIGPYGGWGQSTVPFSGSDELDSVSCLASGDCGFIGVETNSSSGFNGGKPFQTGLLGEVNSVVEAVNVMDLPGNSDLSRGAATKVSLNGVSCPAIDSCVAVGSYSTSTGAVEPLTVAQAVLGSLSWGQPAAQVALPPDASLGSQSADLQAIACSSAGNCQAVGSYTNATGGTEPMVATEAGGTWAQAVGIPAAGNANAQLQAIFCMSAGNCEAVGQDGGGGADQPMAVAESNGQWGAATQLSLPVDAGTSSSDGRETSLDSVSCTTPTDCQAVGGYVDSGGSQEPLAETETNGIWGLTTGGITPPTDAAGTAGAQTANLNGIACFPLTNCLAVGDYLTATGAAHAMHVTFAPEQTGFTGFRKLRASGARLTVQLTCRGHAGSACVGTLTLSAVEHLRANKVAATAHKRTRLVIVASARYGVASRGNDLNAFDPVLLRLSATGRRLLTRNGQLHATLAASADGAVAKTVTRTVVLRAA